LLSLAPVSPAPCVASDNSSLSPGEAGIGKTTLVDAFHQAGLLPTKFENCSGQCVEGFGGKRSLLPNAGGPGQLVRDSDGSRVAQTLGSVLHLAEPVPLSDQSGAARGSAKGDLGRPRASAWYVRFVTLGGSDGRKGPLILIFEISIGLIRPLLISFPRQARRRGPAKLLLLGTYRPTDVIISQSPLRPSSRTCLFISYARDWRLSAWKNLTWLST